MRNRMLYAIRWRWRLEQSASGFFIFILSPAIVLAIALALIAILLIGIPLYIIACAGESINDRADNIQHANKKRGSVTPPVGFPRWWELFRFLLPREVQERVYEPCLEELKEDYLKAAPLWRGKWVRRWLTFCFGVRSAALVFRCLSAVASSKARKAAFALFVVALGAGNVEHLRDWFFGKFGWLP